MTDLLELAAELVAIGSVSHRERALADRVEAELSSVGDLEVTRVEDNVVARTSFGRPRRLALAGHLDTVPPSGNEHPRIDGDVLHGLGSADMKGGLAVMLSLAAEPREPVCDVTYVFYACEEVASRHSGLRVLERERPDLLSADAAVLAEPTGALVEAGCQGVLRLEVVMRGVRAHGARPWTGRNAIHRLAPVLELVAGFEERRPVLDGCEYREVLQAVGVSGGVAGNVVPDEARLALSHRFAPDRDADEALEAIRAHLAPSLSAELGDEVLVEDRAPAARPLLGDPLLTALVAASGAPPRAKLGWTDVAFFASRGVPAANFGPGDPLVAHRSDERVGRDDLEAVHRALSQVVYGR
ncbi:MAG: succinyl-diaminopimelate desuccinylase [Actinomycetota bacterium]|nr:succinyl-diaminopimelate desuccinylase [Actinomycetota bacterium]